MKEARLSPDSALTRTGGSCDLRCGRILTACSGELRTQLLLK